MGSSSAFGALAATGLSNVGLSVITGSGGVSPGACDVCRGGRYQGSVLYYVCKAAGDEHSTVRLVDDLAVFQGCLCRSVPRKLVSFLWLLTFQRDTRCMGLNGWWRMSDSVLYLRWDFYQNTVPQHVDANIQD